jgi:tetratricopeptide (TPR) repeat protein
LYPTKYDASPLLGLIGKQWKYIQTTRPELYDLQEDPGEQINLAEIQPQRARAFKERLAQLLEQIVRQQKSQDSMSLDNRTLQHLQSLGYITGSSVTEDFSFDQSKEDPKNLIDYHNRSREISHLLVENRLPEARDLVEKLAKQRPVFGLYELGTHVAIRQKDYRSAIRYGEKALALEDPSKLYADFHFNLASAYAQTNQIEAAAGHLELILKSAPRDQEPLLTKRVQIHNQLGGLRNKQKKFDLAIAQFKESVKLNPKQPGILHTLAQILLDCPDPTLRDPYKAVELARLACEQTQSRDPRYLNTLTVAYFAVGDYSGAVKTSEKAVGLARAKGDQELAAKLQKQLDVIERVWTESVSKSR